MQLEPNIDYYVIDLLSSDNLIFAINDVSLLDYIKETFPILYELNEEINNTSDLLKKHMCYSFAEEVLEYLTLPRYIKVYNKNGLDFFEAYTNTRLSLIEDKTLDITKKGIKDNCVMCIKFNLVANLNFFCPMKEVKKLASNTKEELMRILLLDNKIYKKTI